MKNRNNYLLVICAFLLLMICIMSVTGFSWGAAGFSWGAADSLNHNNDAEENIPEHTVFDTDN